MKKNILILLIILTSCSSSRIEKVSLEGRYKAKVEEGLIEIVLEENNRFSFRNVIGLIDSKSKGDWILKENKIILNSDSTYLKNKIFVDEIKTESEPYFKIHYPDKLAAFGAYIIFNNKEELGYEINDSGKINLPKELKVSNFKIYHLGKEYFYKVLSEDSFEVTIYFDDLGKTYFETEEYVLKRNKLISEEKTVFVKR
ncbi:MAG: hypothetical protein ACSHW7_12640 [Patiriisocius sp.]|uniref:hypothetical protein n=1 Tax=Patiriisocius sp. TaxID=2822396 RepID=UPI003EF5F666